MSVHPLPSGTGAAAPAPAASVGWRAWLRGRDQPVVADIAMGACPVAAWFVGGMLGLPPLVAASHLAIILLLLVVPRAGYLAMIPILPFSNAMPFPPHGPIVAEAVAMAISLCIRGAMGTLNVPTGARAGASLAIAFLALTVFQTTLGLGVSGGVLTLGVLSQLDQVIVIVLVFVGGLAFLSADGVLPAMVAYVASVIVVAALGVLHYARPSVLSRLHLLWMLSPDATRYRASGVIPNANFLGLFLAVGLVFIAVIGAWLLVRRQIVGAVVTTAIGTLTTLTILLTYSRAAIVAVWVGIVAAVARTSRRAAVAIIVLGGLGAAVAYPVFLALRLDQTFGSAGTEAAAAQAASDDLRSGQAIAALRAFLDAPLLGHGFGTFAVLSPTYTGQDTLTSAHNAYLKIAAEQGVLGLGLFLALAAAIAVPLWRAPLGPWTSGLAVLGVIGLFSLTGDTLSSAQAAAPAAVVLAAMLVAAERRRRPTARVVWSQARPIGLTG